MTTVAFHDRDRRIIESYALAALLLAAETTGVRAFDISHADGLRSLTVRSGEQLVRFTYPIWFAGNGCPVSWQMDVVSRAGGTVTVMTGVDAEAPRPHLVRLLRATCDPATLTRLMGAAATGKPDAVARLLGLPAR